MCWKWYRKLSWNLSNLVYTRRRKKQRWKAGCVWGCCIFGALKVKSNALLLIYSSVRKRVAVIKSVFSSRSLLNLSNRQASIIEYLPTLRNICRTEKLKEQGKSKRRFLHYLEGIHLNISKETVNTLASGFP